MRVRISTLAFDVLWRHHALGSKPPALATGPSPGRTARERHEFERLAWRELTPHGDMAAAMSLLRAPSVEYFGWFGGIDRSWSAHVAAGHRAALCVVVDRDQVTLETVPAARAAEALISALPPMPPGRGAVFSMPERPRARDSLLVQVHPDEAELRRCRSLLERPRTGAGLIFSATPGGIGTAVHYFDTGGGRYLCVRRADAGGEPWLVVGPAAASDLVSRLRAA
ncbi:ESX secretion-associated protein EspG [Allokutzneria sp. A3M-2-11 16]|uniref:ESX secretion-associated protein EspG n=1 Tax=Allokutzneria sp. A3M-2-11 16 TaxID=2962043 RepID=UPI0020B8E974|nr:ESX secretion-associated protein EspG [Allokutzneria sp. A3M-2-11 16]MCP3803675.1 ESX secretion-associated protein EspG [Allokutzneria sp. A3M-2-11 16]